MKTNKNKEGKLLKTFFELVKQENLEDIWRKMNPKSNLNNETQMQIVWNTYKVVMRGNMIAKIRKRNRRNFKKYSQK